MSYILDALKRSEQERRRAEAPIQEPVPPPSAPPHRSRAGVVAAVAVAVNLGLLAWILWPQQPEPLPAPAPQPSLAAISGSHRQGAVPSLVAQPEPVPQAASSAPVTAVETTPAVAPAAPAPTPAVAVTPAAAAPAPLLADLPESFRSSVPQLGVSVHVYAEKPAGRWVLVNLQKFQEGAQLPGGVLLERITPNGMVLQYQGQRFQVMVR